MSDPLSITASILAVLQLSITVTQYLKDVQGGSRDRLRLRDEIRSIVCLLEMLKDRVEDPELQETWGKSTVSLGSPNGPLVQFASTLELLTAKLAPTTRFQQVAKTLKWPLDKADVTAMLNSLERQKSLFNLAIQCDHMQLSQEIHREVQKANKQITDLKHVQDKQLRDHEHLNLVAWMSRLSFHAKQLDVLKQHHEGTGLWFFERIEFKSWLAGSGNTLWCPGIPGAGKTVLASAIIHHLESTLLAPDVGIAFVYCDYKEQVEQTVDNLLLSVLGQLVQQQAVISDEVLSMYRYHGQHKTWPRTVEIGKVLRAVSTAFSKVFIIVDALDECNGSNGTRNKLISEIQSLPLNTRALFTSRFSLDIQRSFKNHPELEIRANDADIELYLTNRIHEESRLEKHVQTEPQLAEEIICTIIRNSQGMFLLAQLHLDLLARKQSRKAVRIALKSLPQGIDETYDKVMERINSQDEEDVHLAKRVLSWISFAMRPLTVAEVQNAVAVQELEENESNLDDDALPEEEFIIAVCAGIVSIDRESNVIRLVHYTTKNYFDRYRTKIFPETEVSLAKNCIRYLCLDNFSDGLCTADDSLQDRLNSYPFFIYAAQHWGNHARGALETTSKETIVKFLENKIAMQGAIQAGSVPEHRYSGWSQRYPRDVPQLVYSASYGLTLMVQFFLDSGCDIDARGTDGQTALISAAEKGHETVVDQLIHAGANVNTLNFGGEIALTIAAGQGHLLVVERLISAGSSVDTKALDGWTPLMASAYGGHDSIVECLITAGADPNITSLDGESALLQATRGGHFKIMISLLNSGARVSVQTSAGRRALAVARAKGNEEIVRQLIEKSENISRQAPNSKPAFIRNDVEDCMLWDLESTASTLINKNLSSMNTPSTSDHNSSKLKSDNSLEMMERGLFSGKSFRQHYLLHTKLGNGHFAEVFLCSDKMTGLKAAVKRFRPKHNMSKVPESVKQEIKILSTLNHPNIGVIKDAIKEDDRIYLVLELCPEGDLFNWIVTKQKLTESETRGIFKQLIGAIKYLHDRNVIHRDIKPENIMLLNKDLTIQLADFGLAKELDAKEGESCFTTLCGSPSYVAPEIIQDQIPRKYSFGADIWSSGVVLYICLCGFPPFSDELYSEQNPYHLNQQIQAGRFDYPSPYWDHIGDEALDLIDHMITVDASKRYAADDCLKHYWMIKK